ncbi:MAG: hypothetical protein MPW15_16745 [Candidatus Manganitrophus sp.]|nr:hypothetical protein [Candidatus Manganitrophus sp.]
MSRGSRVGRLFFYMTFMGGVWLFSFSWMYSAVAEEVALAWAKAGYLAVTFLPSLIYDFSIVSLHLEYQRRVWRRISWSFSALFALAVLLSDLLVGGVYAYWWGYYPKVAWLSIPFLLFFFGIMFLSLWEYDGQFRNAVPSVHRERTKSFLKAFGVGYFASFDFLANYGVPLYPFGYIPIFIFFLIMAKTIRRYRLIDMSPGPCRRSDRLADGRLSHRLRCGRDNSTCESDDLCDARLLGKRADRKTGRLPRVALFRTGRTDSSGRRGNLIGG